jgi:two-component system sensor histidine kinase RpfC
MNLAKKQSNWLTRLNQRLSKTGDSEPEQAKLRLGIGLMIIVYISLPWGTDESFAKIIFSVGDFNISLATFMTILYSSCSLAIFVWIILNPVASPVRRICGTVVDLVSLSFLMFHSGDGSVPLFFIYLWVILGNGFRYGVNYLYVSQFVGLGGFIIVIYWGEYWQQNRSFGTSLFLMLCLLPLYASFLLKKLHIAIDMAKQANEAKSRFLANMSHELRTPLNGVIGMGELLRETKLNYEQQELVGTMYSSANTLLELIENILDISKIEAGKISIESEDFDLHSLVNTVIYMMAPMGDTKGLTVFCNIDPETPFALKGDQQHIRQILINLVNNGIKFTEKGSVILSVNLVGGTESKPRIRFEISDTGIGISEKAIETIFDNFTQADASTSRSYGGTGLGTTISKELVELMGGKIGVESAENQGSKFWFELPFIVSKITATSIAENRILLLASEDTAAVIRPSLKSWDVNFDWVRSSSLALSQLMHANDQDQLYETVIVDQKSLVDIDAVQFAQMVKSEGLLETISLVLINSSQTMIDANLSSHYYISTIANPEEKRSLFNSLHAAQSVKINDSKVVTMAEHYAKQAGAKTLNILVAEDNKVNQQVIEGILGNAGHIVRMANTGSQALDLLSEEMESIDMVILDMNMPEISGVEVVKSLRFMDTGAKIPVIMLTADATPEAKETCIKAGANRFLTKPTNAHSLLECIASLSRNLDTVNASQKLENISRPHIVSKIAESSWYDYTVLHELDILGGDPDFIQSLLESFCKQGMQHVVNIKSAIQDDYPEYRENLHALKGSATELGAGSLVDICLEAESFKPYEIGSDKMVRLYTRLEKIFDNTVSALSSAVTDKQISHPGKTTAQQR